MNDVAVHTDLRVVIAVAFTSTSTVASDFQCADLVRGSDTGQVSSSTSHNHHLIVIFYIRFTVSDQSDTHWQIAADEQILKEKNYKHLKCRFAF